ncbi:HTH-like domain-containing protein [Shewanella algae]
MSGNSPGSGSSSRNHCMAEAHLQMIKYADDLKNITAKEFCEEV